MLFLYAKAAPAPPAPPPLEPPPEAPPPTATTETAVTPAGATQENVPEVVKDCEPGGTNGVTLLLAALAALVPPGVIATTVNVYAVPTVKPETVTGDAAPVPVMPPGLEVALKVSDPAPGSDDAVKATVAEAPPAVAVPIVGAPGLLGQMPRAT